jgi:RPA family protein
MANRKENKGGNSELHGKYWTCPEYVINALKTAVDRYESLNKNDKNSEGYKRAKGILNNNLIEYSQMKRIKNWFDTFEGDHSDMEYRLNGGKTMHNWVDSTLNRETEAIKAPKKIKMETGLSNQFIKSHNKDVNKITRQTLKANLPKLHKDISGQVWRGKPVYEEVEKIKKLITYKYKK